MRPYGLTDVKIRRYIMRQVGRSRLAILLAVAIVTFVGAAVFGDCETYNNSRIAWIGGQNICAYTGSGCTECWDSGGNSCVTNGSSCVPEVRPL